MKKIIIIILIFIFLIVAIPAMFVRPFKFEEKVSYEEEKKPEYDYKNYSKINLLHKKDGTIENIDLDEYLLGVVSSEMPASFEQEALNAQAVVARTYTIYQIENNSSSHQDADLCDDSSCCQAWISKEDRLNKWDEENRQSYWKKIEDAVYSTQGKIITYESKAIDAFFHSNSGGKTEIPVNVWGGSNYPYLQTVETSGEDGYTQYSSQVVCTKDEFIAKIKEKHENFQIDFENPECIKILEYTDGNRVKTIQIGNLNLSGVEIRSILGLKSANFTVEIKEDGNIYFEVKGYGHGVGMSQTGADSMAKQGKTYEQIIKHFYKDVEISNI